VKFYTTEGNSDLVGNIIPVFFIQAAINFRDVVYAVKWKPIVAILMPESAMQWKVWEREQNYTDWIR
jgi:catalase